MAEILSSIISLVGLIDDTASKAKLNRQSCKSLARHVLYAEHELKQAPNIKTGPVLSLLRDLLQECLNDLEKFANPHGIHRILKGPVSEICERHKAELTAWIEKLHAQVSSK